MTSSFFCFFLFLATLLSLYLSLPFILPSFLPSFPLSPNFSLLTFHPFSLLLPTHSFLTLNLLSSHPFPILPSLPYLFYCLSTLLLQSHPFYRPLYPFSFCLCLHFPIVHRFALLLHSTISITLTHPLHFTLLHLTSPYLTLPFFLTLPHSTLPYLTFSHLTLPHLTLHYITLIHHIRYISVPISVITYMLPTLHLGMF